MNDINPVFFCGIYHNIQHLSAVHYVGHLFVGFICCGTLSLLNGYVRVSYHIHLISCLIHCLSACLSQDGTTHHTFLFFSFPSSLILSYPTTLLLLLLLLNAVSTCTTKLTFGTLRWPTVRAMKLVGAVLYHTSYIYYIEIYVCMTRGPIKWCTLAAAIKLVLASTKYIDKWGLLFVQSITHLVHDIQKAKRAHGLYIYNIIHSRKNLSRVLQTQKHLHTNTQQ